MANDNDQPLSWVFGYGSLIWRPGFPFVRAERALMRGVHRRLCIFSHRHRGTPEQPGLVFGLERGGSCIGMAFEVAPERWIEVRDYLREREQVTGVYRETRRPVKLASGEIVPALTFVTDPGHIQYAGRLAIDDQFALVRRASGASGPNADYVVNTASHLEQLGIPDGRLDALSARLRSAATDEMHEAGKPQSGPAGAR
ncbi:gamma-glutamylcyclotransferase [Pelagibacterium montanilacus]|uniref:gamma-glutamylcyclotransferase n=1 Tax=Pelagibacterium montanilacus TaxID=2185280 RepID=UPI000F8ED5AF|nr:gamma-glutamylcyclotransferase [Pelagibacterium montanilacus]